MDHLETDGKSIFYINGPWESKTRVSIISRRAYLVAERKSLLKGAWKKRLHLFNKPFLYSEYKNILFMAFQPETFTLIGVMAI